MMNTKNLFYFGKLRRRREFVKSTEVSNVLYTLWEVWFNKCSRKNSFLPFLNNIAKKDKPIWLFVLKYESNYKLGLTVLSSDKSEREYPFVIYCETPSFDIVNTENLKEYMHFFINRLNKFKKIVSIGDITDEDLEIFKADKDNNDISLDLIELINSYSSQAIEVESNNKLVSFWININSSSIISHEGALTCTLHNRVYG